MGKGGQKSTTSSKSQTAYKLSKLSDEELRKWAKAYGENTKSDDRESLLKILVCFFIRYI